MRLSQAMQINQAPAPAGRPVRTLYLACGFTPLHLATYLRAYARNRFAGDDVRVATGLYGDLEGSLRTATTSAEGVVVVLEWGDLDARLGWRSAAGWTAGVLADIGRQAPERLQRLEGLILGLARDVPVALIPPTLPASPITHLPPAQAGVLELRLRANLAGFLERIAASPRVRIASEEALARLSPVSGRHDAQLDLRTDFPYTLAHAAAVTGLAVECLFPPAPAKGLITDLDDTLWQGILGDAGVAGVAWSLDAHAQPHALYQKLLASLAESGILIAVASKNDPAMVEEALARPDLLLGRAQVFPVAAHWGPKSESAARILSAWNIGADSVVFVDDSPMELAEVGEHFPAMECLRFPAGDAAGVLDLIRHLRARFGKTEVREEDVLRARSLSASAAFAGERAADDGAFLARLEARLTLEFLTNGEDGRALELVNKTNQFNLNGLRFSEADWRALFQQPGAFLLTAAYEDRFGPLGKIAAMAGRRLGSQVEIDAWVLSCRAFSRQIEFQMIRGVLETYGAAAVGFAYQPTPRNGPLQDFLAQFFPAGLQPGRLYLTATGFAGSCPALSHQVITKNG